MPFQRYINSSALPLGAAMLQPSIAAAEHLREPGCGWVGPEQDKRQAQSFREKEFKLEGLANLVIPLALEQPLQRARRVSELVKIFSAYLHLAGAAFSHRAPG